MPQEPLKSMKKNKGNTRDLPTVTVTSKLDPRLKAYQDSLNLYNKSNKLQQYLKEKNKKPYSELRNASYSLFDLMHDSYTLQKNKIKPVDKLTYGFEDVPGMEQVPHTKVLSVGKGVDDKLLINGKPASFGSVPIYKKPVQPIKYQKPEPPKAEVKAIKGSKKYFINETEVDEPTFNKIAPIKSMKKNEK